MEMQNFIKQQQEYVPGNEEDSDSEMEGLLREISRKNK